MENPIVPKWLCIDAYGPVTFFGAEYARACHHGGSRVFRAEYPNGVLNYVEVKDVAEIVDAE